MAPIQPDPKRIKSFRTAAAFSTWLSANHDRQPEIGLKIHKKDSGLSSVTPAEALDMALVDMLARGETIVPQRGPRPFRRR